MDNAPHRRRSRRGGAIDAPTGFFAGLLEIATRADVLARLGLCVGAGYAFGNVPIVKNNFSLVTIGIVIVSILPMVVEYLRYRRDGRISAD